MKESILKNQVIPIGLTALVCGAMVILLYGEILALNHFTATDIITEIRWGDVLVGLTIYLKTSIDFAIFIARMMETNSGWKSRVAIEIGTAFGNAAGTLAILGIWSFFKEIHWLLAIMILIAALVLFQLAEDGLQHAKTEDKPYTAWFKKSVTLFEKYLSLINRAIAPILNRIVPHLKADSSNRPTFWALFRFSFTIPFILGLDDFAGYVPLFSIVNVFGFAIGVFVGHMILNIFLYLSPKHTVKIVKNPVISFLGSIVFVLLGIWGLFEVIRLLGNL